ncbi:NAD(P)-dependent oxidoreductase [Nocardioides sp. SYSU D00038]|uniref:NAD(P)-dependent oxidoreductase n=1 Tax=Nocardioides sp. SYSU D00038 TaxID=2812554 RepID=UPI001968275A|nr:NAD(P)-binding domain-containing protein [Nocardioides sp. SYSU D00038]
MTTNTISTSATSTPTTTAPAAVTVLGLGAMGSAIARTLLGAGHRVTVWNRTASRGEPLRAAGAAAAPTAREAVGASPLVVVCLLDTPAVDAVLAGVGDAVAGRALVNFTSGSPDQARRLERWAAEHGAAYLDGGVMADPPDLGTEHAHLSLSGSRTVFEGHEPTLRALGATTYYGEDAGLASLELMAQVGVAYELLIGLLHTLRLVRDEGADVARFADRVADALSASYPPLIRAIGTAVRDGVYPPDLGPLSVQAALMDDLVEHRRSLGVDTTRMAEVKRRMDERIAAGHGDQGFSSLFATIARATG